MKNLINYNKEALKVYKVGIYARLSRDDENIGESESIKNQVDIVSRYVLENGWNIVDIYCDDGYTGTNFERPEFSRMIADIETHKIDMVVTKDFSRLGRDYIKIGYYMQVYFPSKNVRYVTVNDAVDTNHNDYMMAAFLSLFNDLYPLDISKKVRAVMDSKRRNGKYIGAFPPYGYEKSKEDKNKLVIDEVAANVVKRIFGMYLEGIGIKGIATRLNQEGITCPSEYKSIKYENYNNPKTKVNLWKHETVKSILESPTYMGCLTQGKYRKVNHKVDILKTQPKSKWIIVQDTHEPIINKDSFMEAQAMLTSKSNTAYSGDKQDHLLTGLLYCGDCGASMTFSKAHSSGNYYAICSTYKRYTSKYCSRHSIEEDTLVKLISEDIRRLAREAVDNEKLMLAAQKKGIIHHSKDLDSQIDTIDKRLTDIKKKIKMLYEDRVKGTITESDFIEFSKDFNSDRDSLVSLRNEISNKKDQINRVNSEAEFIIHYVKQFTDFNKIDRNALVKLIDKIDIYENKRIVIHYKFKKPE